MPRAYLTIDDSPSHNTVRYMDFLAAHGIRPIWFFWGDRVVEDRAAALACARQGACIGNHSYTHPHFSELTPAQAKAEIDRMDAEIEALYAEAGTARGPRLFRFPYFDRGGENESALQAHLRDREYRGLDAAGQPADTVDVPATFNFEEYRLPQQNGFGYDDVLRNIDRAFAPGGAFTRPETQIVLIHDHAQTEALHPGYFEDLIGRLLTAGVTFVS